MYSKQIIIAAFCVATILSAAFCGDDDSEGLVILAKVGDAEITASQVDKLIKQGGRKYPGAQAGQRLQKLHELIYRELMHTYLDKQKVQLDQEEMDKAKDKLTTIAAAEGKTVEEILQLMGMTMEQLPDTIRGQKFFSEQVSEKKLKKLIADHPNYFNGTKATARHILLKCDQTASTEKQNEVIAKLEKIKADIKSGKTTFEEAAKKYSVCPSGKSKGGDLGEFEFFRMVIPFSAVAYDQKIGTISSPVRTQFGFHLIKTTAVDPGNDKTDTKRNMGFAQKVIQSRISNEIFDQALTTCKIVIYEQKKVEKAEKKGDGK